MCGYLARAHAARVDRQDAFVNAGHAALVLGNQLRCKARVAVTRYRNLDFAKVAGERLGRLAIAYVAGGVGYRTAP